MRKKQFHLSGLVCLTLLSACAQEEVQNTPKDAPQEKKEVVQHEYREPHEYGGWYCPDNVIGFPPVNIHELDKIPAVSDRLPTKEETQTEASLIFIDTEKYPDAYALDIDLPQVASIYSVHSKMEELVIIIQAVVIGNDTVVGYRFPSGGNGSAWYDEVTFLKTEEIENTPSSPFVFEKVHIMANSDQIWKAFSSTQYAKDLGKRFNEEAFFQSDWSSQPLLHLESDLLGEKATGIMGNVFGNLYIQIDYDYNGFHYTEKMLFLENKSLEMMEVFVVMGPYKTDFKTNQSNWKAFLADLKTASEK